VSDPMPVRRAIISCFDKSGVAELAQALHTREVSLVSTGSTAAAIRDAGVPVTEVADLTGFPECLDGRVKTLHPGIHAGILADRSKPEHTAALAEHGIEPIDLVVVNLFPVSDQPGVAMVDIGGPAMVRAAAKNHAHVGVVVDPRDYDALLVPLPDDRGLPAHSRRALAEKAFARTAAYDADVAGWLSGDAPFPPLLTRAWRRAEVLRYGENPHQQAAYYVEPGSCA
jgi:phosphoribosylaminoimidazolecarboxamide formyltransferase / IMP cyclohydrolase